jgi:hypothetical protein
MRGRQRTGEARQVTTPAGIKHAVRRADSAVAPPSATSAAILRILKRQDFWAGLLFIVCGAVGLYLAKDLTFGTATRMGAGYLPRVLSWMVVGLGIAVLLRSLIGGGVAEGAWRFRPLVFVLAGIGVFGLMIERVGLALTVFVVALVTSSALRDIRWIEATIFAVVIATFSVLVFVTGLKLPLPVWPR